MGMGVTFFKLALIQQKMYPNIIHILSRHVYIYIFNYIYTHRLVVPPPWKVCDTTRLRASTRSSTQKKKLLPSHARCAGPSRTKPSWGWCISSSHLILSLLQIWFAPLSIEWMCQNCQKTLRILTTNNRRKNAQKDICCILNPKFMQSSIFQLHPMEKKQLINDNAAQHPQ